MSRYLKWHNNDANEVAVAANNEKIAENLRNAFPYPYTLEDAQSYVNACIAHGMERQITRAVVADGKVIGSIGVFMKDDVYEKSGELGYWLAEEYWGRGIMTEAIKKICREAFDNFDIIRIFAEPFEYNKGSIRILEKAGFIYEGTMRNGVFKNGKVHSYRMYSLLKEE